jgi:hypothetical protein
LPRASAARDGLQGLRQLAAHHARGCQPEHYLQVLGRLSRPLAQFPSTGKGRHGLACRCSMRGDEAWSQHQLEIKFALILAGARRQAASHLETSLQMCDGLEVGGTQGSVPAGLQPIGAAFFAQSRFREVVRQSFGLSLDQLGELLLERVRDGGVQTPVPALQETGIGGIPYQCVLEAINRVRNLSTTKINSDCTN